MVSAEEPLRSSLVGHWLIREKLQLDIVYYAAVECRLPSAIVCPRLSRLRKAVSIMLAEVKTCRESLLSDDSLDEG